VHKAGNKIECNNMHGERIKNGCMIHFAVVLQYFCYTAEATF